MPPSMKIVAAMLADPAADHYGLDLMRGTGLASGTLYPALVGLVAAGWIDARWPDDDPADGRPARRRYRLTPRGAEAGRVESARLGRRRTHGAAQVVGA